MATYKSGAKGEAQKPTTEDYRKNWERIWGKKKTEESAKDDTKKD